MDFGNPLRKRKSEIKYEAFYCSEIQLQRLTADKLSRLNYKQSRFFLQLLLLINFPSSLRKIYQNMGKKKPVFTEAATRGVLCKKVS